MADSFKNMAFGKSNRLSQKGQQVTMYIKNRRDSSKLNGYSSFQLSLYLESEELRNRLLAIY
jgi:hypothetical protein